MKKIPSKFFVSVVSLCDILILDITKFLALIFLENKDFSIINKIYAISSSSFVLSISQ